MENIIFPFPDRESCIKIYKDDPCYSKIPVDERDTVFNKAWDTGIAEARAFLEKHEMRPLSMEEVLRENGYRIETQDTDYVIGKSRFFCELYPSKHLVVIYKQSVQLWADSQGMEYDKAKNIILAHEFFHHFEANKIGWVSKQCQVPMLVLGELRIGKTGIASLSEVAANAFANEFYRYCVETEILFEKQ